jgi:hypothetical protein
MLSSLARRTVLLSAAFAFLVLASGHTARVLAGNSSGNVTITTDQSQYQVGNIAKICYTVLGAGPVTILDTQADGTTQSIVDGNDNGSGGCFEALVTPPAGNECLQINDTSNGNTGSAQTCFQVQGSSTQQPAAQDCGEVDVLGGHVTTSGSAGIENCFYQAYQSCTPATLEVSISGVDAGVKHTFGLIYSGGFCAIQDSQQHFIAPRPPGAATTTVCTGLTQTADGGLLFSNCGGADVQVPAGS